MSSKRVYLVNALPRLNPFPADLETVSGILLVSFSWAVDAPNLHDFTMNSLHDGDHVSTPTKTFGLADRYNAGGTFASSGEIFIATYSVPAKRHIYASEVDLLSIPTCFY
jgi:hypothetical protein